MVAAKIKQIYYPDVPWSVRIADDIAVKLKVLKDVTAPYYPDLDIVGRLHKVAAYCKQDMDDALGKEALCQSDTCGLLERSMGSSQS
jgi:hypothetical protein